MEIMRLRLPRIALKGLSLMEVLVTLLLLSLAMGLIGGFAGEVSSVLRATAGKDRTLEAARLAADRIGDDLAGAIQVVSPTSETSFSLVFHKVDTSKPERLPLPLPDPLPDSWDPYAPNFLQQVSYTVNKGYLIRSVLFDDGDQLDEALIPNLNSLTAEKLSDKNYLITLSNWEGRKVGTVVTRASVRLR